MTRCTYDTRPADEIIAGAALDSIRGLPGLAELPKRELRMLDRFLTWAAARDVETPETDDFVAFAEHAASSRALADLRATFNRILPPDAVVLEALREALRKERPASRRCDRRDRDAIIAEPHFAPFRDADRLSEISLEDLRALDRFLAYAEGRRIEVPTVEDFLDFCADVKSSRRLRAIEAALTKLVPGSPAVLLTLRESIQRKSPPVVRSSRLPRPSVLGVPRHDLPEGWLRTLGCIQTGGDLADSTVQSMEEVLRAYAGSLRDAQLPMAVSLEGVRAHERGLRDRNARPATLHTHTMRLRQFAERHGVPGALLEDLRCHERILRRALGRVAPQKEARYAALPKLPETWALATDLLSMAEGTLDRTTSRRLRNEAAVLALWTFLPLRLADSVLRWGEEIGWRDGVYWVRILTQKASVPLSGTLDSFLLPFLDALVLEGVSPEYLEEMRERAEVQHLPLFRRHDGQPLADDYPSTVWRKHMGTGAHIARTRIHTELGKLGPEGVDSALALCAQKDPRTRAFYQARSLAVIEMRRGQEMIAGLFDDLEDAS